LPDGGDSERLPPGLEPDDNEQSWARFDTWAERAREAAEKARQVPAGDDELSAAQTVHLEAAELYVALACAAVNIEYGGRTA
jgi:hypothetical protein